MPSSAGLAELETECCVWPEAVVVVREAEQKLVMEELDQFSLATIVVPIPDGEDWGTADSLRFLRSKMLVSIGFVFENYLR